MVEDTEFIIEGKTYLEKGIERMHSENENRRYYTEGNTARKLNTVPKKVEQPKRRKKKQVNERISRNSRRARAFDLKYTMALVTAVTILFTACIYMLTIQADITTKRKQIAQLESDLNTLTDMNNEKSKRLEGSVDLTQVYKVATEELGMVYPKNAEGILTSCRFSNLYDIKNMKYVKDDRELVGIEEYKDIPEE